MNTENYPAIADVQEFRNNILKELDSAENKERFIKANADSIYSLGLTMYSGVFTFDSAVYNGLSTSYLDENISLHPEQIKVLDKIREHKGLIFSAPTSFGKTFVIFEYIARYFPKTVVLVVPTLALIDEYKRKIINQYKNVFKRYKVFLSIDEHKEYDFSNYNLFLVTHDRVIDESIHKIIKQIDYLVIDEVYKLQKCNDDRVLILNLAYYNLVSISRKYVLLAPFIRGVDNLDKLDDEPAFYSTNYSPVVNEVIKVPVLNDDERFKKAKEISEVLEGNTLIYFPTVVELNNYVDEITKKEAKYKETYLNPTLTAFINWAKREIHEEWSVIKAMENGYLVHHGQLPLGIRLLEIDLFNKSQDNDNYKMLCTSTLLEGVNTTAKNIIITKPSRGKNNIFDAFDFYNLVGRTGRLYQHCLGTAYYIKGPKDRDYVKNDALKSIEFELTSDSIDIDIINGNYTKHNEFLELINNLNIDGDTYRLEVSSKCRFKTVAQLYNAYIKNKESLFDELYKQSTNKEVSKLNMIRELYKIISPGQYKMKLITFIINKLTYKVQPRLSIKNIVDETKKSYPFEDINDIIKRVIKLKNSYIEYEFYKRIQVVLFFMKCEQVSLELINIVNEKLLKNIEILYYINSPSRKILKDMGIYEKDIEIIINIIGEDFTNIGELQKKLFASRYMIAANPYISVITKYVINRFMLS